MNEPFVVESEHELRALHRALFEAKFHGEPMDPAVPFSPLLADLSRRVVKALKSATDEDWPTWRRAEDHRHRFPVVIGHIARARGWTELDEAKKRELVIILLSPLEAEAATISEPVEAGDRVHEAA